MIEFIIKDLVFLANTLDNDNLFKEANEVTSIIKKIAQTPAEDLEQKWFNEGYEDGKLGDVFLEKERGWLMEATANDIFDAFNPGMNYENDKFKIIRKKCMDAYISGNTQGLANNNE